MFHRKYIKLIHDGCSITIVMFGALKGGGYINRSPFGLSKVGHWRPKKNESSPQKLRDFIQVDVNILFQFKARCFKMFLQQFWNFHLKNWGFMIQFDEHIFQRGWFNHQLVLMLSQSRTHQHVGAVTHRQNIVSLVLKKEQKNAADLIHSEALLTRDIYIHIILQVWNKIQSQFSAKKEPTNLPPQSPSPITLKYLLNLWFARLVESGNRIRESEDIRTMSVRKVFKAHQKEARFGFGEFHGHREEKKSGRVFAGTKKNLTLARFIRVVCESVFSQNLLQQGELFKMCIWFRKSKEGILFDKQTEDGVSKYGPFFWVHWKSLP